VLGSFLIAEMINRKGARLVAVGGLVCLGATMIWFGRVTTPMEYAIGLTLINFLATGTCFNVPGTLLTTWFPRKKGLALGWATMGMSLCTATLVPLMVMLFSRFGVQDTYAVVGGVLIVFGIVSFFWVRNTPEELGCSPDNEQLSKEAMAENLREFNEHKSPFTLPVLLRDRDMWLISVGYGVLWLV
ncbi:MFS transporter, partial [Rubrivivax gelatinosus]|nr:MFS transporter [Rubrivivax gelatinosus]